MFLSHYLASCRQGSCVSKPMELCLSGSLCEVFSLIASEAEESCREIGCHLYLRGNSLEFGEVVRGQKSSVDLPPLTVSGVVPDFFAGTFHVHPYRKRTGRPTSIGPSGGDIIGLYSYARAVNNSVADIVWADTRLFIMFVHQPVDRASVDIAVAKHEASKKNSKYVGKCRQKSAMKTIRNLVVSNSPASLAAEREAFSKIPDAATVFADTNLEMNLELSRVLNHDLYIGHTDELNTASRLITTYYCP
ncbi:hypothetical protein [Spongorhabdus nitratireducens]